MAGNGLAPTPFVVVVVVIIIVLILLFFFSAGSEKSHDRLNIWKLKCVFVKIGAQLFERRLALTQG